MSFLHPIDANRVALILAYLEANAEHDTLDFILKELRAVGYTKYEIRAALDAYVFP